MSSLQHYYDIHDSRRKKTKTKLKLHFYIFFITLLLLNFIIDISNLFFIICRILITLFVILDNRDVYSLTNYFYTWLPWFR